MYLTAEVRWFGRGDAGEQLTSWYRRLPGQREDYPSRVDRYLWLGEDDSLGIKLREGRIEVKQRQEQHGVLSLHPRVEGVLETWGKWSFPLASNWPVMARPESSWVAVSKSRALRRYRLTEAGELETMPMGQFADQGCSLELAAISAAGESWWSLALEAHAAGPAVIQILRQVAAKTFAPSDPPKLAAIHSFGYPQWLTGLER